MLRAFRPLVQVRKIQSIQWEGAKRQVFTGSNPAAACVLSSKVAPDLQSAKRCWVSASVSAISLSIDRKSINTGTCSSALSISRIRT